MRISDWSSDVCSSDLIGGVARPGIVHRIDKDTSGLIVAAKTDSAHEGLARQFAAHTIGRRYAAVVNGRPVPPAGRIEGPVERSPRPEERRVGEECGRTCISRWSLFR